MKNSNVYHSPECFVKRMTLSYFILQTSGNAGELSDNIIERDTDYDD